ncbi:MAG: hypothetical protein IJO75_01200 [Clostridia bacterium]|nr:hypothetical protein [Clostridia bacterium]MBQ9860853.1 hypothetical protein [Clostridia bacterium]
MAGIIIRDENGQERKLLVLKGEKGEKGDPGTVSFDELTDEQKEELAELAGKVTVDLELNDQSENAIANRVVTAIFNELADVRVGADDNTYDTAGDAVRYQFVEIKQTASGAASYASDLDRRLTLEVEPAVAENAAKIGDVETALDSIIAIQEALIGGDAV